LLRDREETEDNVADWVLGHASRVPAENYQRPVNRENTAESVRCKADESRGKRA